MHRRYCKPDGFLTSIPKGIQTGTSFAKSRRVFKYPRVFGHYQTRQTGTTVASISAGYAGISVAG